MIGTIEMTKTTKLLEEVVFKYHPQIKNKKDIKAMLIKNPDWVNIERLAEETCAAVGGYNFVDGNGYDFDDGEALGCANSEFKTASVWPRPVNGKGSSYKLEISNVCRTGPFGSEKSGTLRVVLYNPISDTVKYYFIPKAYWSNMITIHPTSGVGKVIASWNSKTDTCNKLDKFEVKNFKVLALLAPNELDDIGMF
tara:strand:+ start:2206 stop:2793 length:588 start_codon:yes stop_codon:yes gene_type:complete